MNRRNHLLSVLLATAIALTVAPATVHAALANTSTMFLRTTYVLKANLDYAKGTISATETINLTNTSGTTISKLNLSVMPKAFGELVSIGSYTVDGKAVSAAWSNNANLVLQLGRNVPDGGTAVVKLAFKVIATSTIGTSLEGRLSKANGIMQVSHWFPIISNGHGMRYPGDSQFTRAATKIRLELTTDSSTVRIAAPGKVITSVDRTHVYELTDARDFAFGASPSLQGGVRAVRRFEGRRLLHDRRGHDGPGQRDRGPGPLRIGVRRLLVAALCDRPDRPDGLGQRVSGHRVPGPRGLRQPRGRGPRDRPSVVVRDGRQRAGPRAVDR